MANPFNFDPAVFGKRRLLKPAEFKQLKTHILAGKSQQEAFDLVFPPEVTAASSVDDELPPSAP